MIIKGKLIVCKREKKEFEKGRSKEGLFVTLKEVELSDEQKKKLLEVFKESGTKFTPSWLKEFEGYASFCTQYDLPYIALDKSEHKSIEEGIKEGLKWMGADVAISVALKEGALYPNAIKFLSEGTGFDPFAEFDNMEED